MKGKIRVGVIFGGRSGEHRVSLASAASVIEAIDKSKYEVIPIGITPQGRWIAGGDPLAFLMTGQEEAKYIGPPPILTADSTAHQELTVLDRTTPSMLMSQKLDVVFPVLHGPFGEDGTVQGFLELVDLPYVGAGVLASAVGMDKSIMKALFRERNFPVLPALTIKRWEWEENPQQVQTRIERHLSYPLFVKPVNLGSSVGISKVHAAPELPAAMNTAALYDRKILIEEGIECREIECAVLGNEQPFVSVVGEIVPHKEFYDYEAKYTPGEADILIPAPLDAALAEQVRSLAREAFLTLDCAGMARVDFFLEKHSQKLYLNEINTIPGFTATSMYAKLWEATGISYPDLIDRLLHLAIERHQDKRRSRTGLEEEKET